MALTFRRRERLNGVGRVIVVVLVVAWSAAASAEVRVGAAVPFRAAQLVEALSARGAPVGDLTVDIDDAGNVRVVSAAGVYQIALGTRTGASAARAVAVHLAATALPTPM